MASPSARQKCLDPGSRAVLNTGVGFANLLKTESNTNGATRRTVKQDKAEVTLRREESL